MVIVLINENVNYNHHIRELQMDFNFLNIYKYMDTDARHSLNFTQEKKKKDEADTDMLRAVFD